jgi:hypothetical protein
MDNDGTAAGRLSRAPTRRSRRQLLTGAATAGIGAIAARTVLAATPAYAGTDGDVILGTLNTETAPTTISNTRDGGIALAGSASGTGVGVQGGSDSGSGVLGSGVPGVLGLTNTPGSSGVVGNVGSTPSANGVFGQAENDSASGVYGQNDGTGFGVAGRAGNGTGVMGDSQAGTGVSAHTVTGTALQVTAEGAGSRGMVGTDGGSGDGPAVEAKLANPANPSWAVFARTAGTGPAVFALIANSASTSAAVSAATAGTGPAVAGQSSKAGGRGVQGRGENGAIGVQGLSDTGIGVYAESGPGVALHVVGKATFSRSGLATIKAGSKTVTVRMAGVTSASLVLATLHQAAGPVAVASAVPSSGSFTIHLTRAPASGVQAAYLVLG